MTQYFNIFTSGVFFITKIFITCQGEKYIYMHIKVSLFFFVSTFAGFVFTLKFAVD